MKRGALAAFVAVVLASCGSPLSDQGGLAAPVRDDAEASRSQPAVAYVVVAGEAIRHSDAPAYLRLPGAAPVRIGDGLRFATAGPDTLLLERFDGHLQAYRVAPAPALLYERMNQGGPPRGIAFGDEIYELQHGTLVATDAKGTTRNIALPAARPSGDVTFCETRKGGMFDPKASGARAIATANGHLYAFVSTYLNGAVIDVTNGRRLDLPESGPAIAMTSGSDGKVYALTIDQRCNTNTPVIRRIDPITMREDAVIDTHRPLGFDSIGLVGGHGGATYVHAVTATSAELLRVDAQSVTSIALPPDSGLLSSAAPDGSIWLFGGRARNVVSRFDTSTGQVEHVVDADAPDGSFVGAVLFPDASGGR